jgi:hypothetical protein
MTGQLMTCSAINDECMYTSETLKNVQSKPWPIWSPCPKKFGVHGEKHFSATDFHPLRVCIMHADDNKHMFRRQQKNGYVTPKPSFARYIGLTHDVIGTQNRF